MENKIAKVGSEVQVQYIGKLLDGTTFDSTFEENRDPLIFTIGDSTLIPGFEKAVIGMLELESKRVKIPIEEAYGPYREELIQNLDRQDFPEDMELTPGEQLVFEDAEHGDVFVLVKEASKTTVTIDANHPLAGEDLIFEILLQQIL
jgi:peptidylprolyl isomerase